MVLARGTDVLHRKSMKNLKLKLQQLKRQHSSSRTPEKKIELCPLYYQKSGMMKYLIVGLGNIGEEYKDTVII